MAFKPERPHSSPPRKTGNLKEGRAFAWSSGPNSFKKYGEFTPQQKS